MYFAAEEAQIPFASPTQEVAAALVIIGVWPGNAFHKSRRSQA
jgi:hypothetical protein